MIRAILAFVILAVLMHLCITAWRALSGQEKWSLTKSIGYSIIVSMLAGLVLSFLVIVF